jgi:serine O-acetyltransferase
VKLRGVSLPVRLFRLSHYLLTSGHSGAAKVVMTVNFLLFKVLIPPEVSVGKNFEVGHLGVGIVIHGRTAIGDDVFLHHGVTLAADVPPEDARCQRIGSGVTIGARAIVLGPVTIGDDVAIGAGAVVTCDLPRGAVAVGSPAKIIGMHGAHRHKWRQRPGG